MRNLEILLHASTSLSQLDSDNGEEVAIFTVDEFSHRLYFLTTQQVLYCFGYSQLCPANTCKLKYQGLINVDSKARAVSMNYIQELTALVITFSNGSIFTYCNQGETEGK